MYERDMMKRVVNAPSTFRICAAGNTAATDPEPSRAEGEQAAEILEKGRELSIRI